MTIKVTTWNQNRSETCARVALRENADILLVQEPWKNARTRDIHGPNNGTYYKVWGLEGRAAAYIKRELDIGRWDCETGPDWVRITLSPNDDMPTYIFNLYCEPHRSKG